MNVLIIGKGVVGSALGEAIESARGHRVTYFDPPKGIQPSFDGPATVCVCVPTAHDPASPHGFDEGPLRSALEWTWNTLGRATAVIKSTVPPGTTQRLQAQYPDLDLLFSPEFLTEATASHNALKPARQIVGYTAGRERVAELALGVFPRAPDSRVMPCTEAELVKYFSNALYALKVTFANQMFELADALGADYEVVRAAAQADPMLAPNHLDVWHKGFRGFGGKCLPKDLRTLIAAMTDAGLDTGMLDAAAAYNYTLVMAQAGEPTLRAQSPAASAPSQDDAPSAPEMP